MVSMIPAHTRHVRPPVIHIHNDNKADVDYKVIETLMDVMNRHDASKYLNGVKIIGGGYSKDGCPSMEMHNTQVYELVVSAKHK